MSETLMENVRRLQNAKAAIRQAIIDQGVPVSSKLLLDDYADKIAQISGGGGGGSDPGGIAGTVTYYEPASVNRTLTGVTSISTSGSRTIRDYLFNILNSYFPNMLHTEDYGDQYGIAGPGRSAANCIYIDTRWRDNTNNYCMEVNDWGQQRDASFIYDGNGGELAIYDLPIKDGVLIGFGGTLNIRIHFYKAFIKVEPEIGDDYIIYLNVDGYETASSSTREYLSVENMMVEAYPSFYNDVRPLAAPQVATDIISMSKMYFGGALHDDIFIATTIPESISYHPSCFTYDNINYVTLNDPDGYCPMVFKYDGEVATPAELPEVVEVPQKE